LIPFSELSYRIKPENKTRRDIIIRQIVRIGFLNMASNRSHTIIKEIAIGKRLNWYYVLTNTRQPAN
jgi:hypothetical protein